MVPVTARVVDPATDPVEARVMVPVEVPVMDPVGARVMDPVEVRVVLPEHLSTDEFEIKFYSDIIFSQNFLIKILVL